MSKPIIEWLKDLDNPFTQQKAVTNFLSFHGINSLAESDNMHDAICDAFQWDETPEGQDFWSYVAKQYFDG